MSKRMVVLSVLAAAMLFGVITSGCNRNRDVSDSRRSRQEKRDQTRKQSKTKKAKQTERYDDDSRLLSMRESGPRPAEVLASTVRRSPNRNAPPERARPRGPASARPISANEFARPGYEPLPEPVPVQAQAPAGYPYYQQPRLATYQPEPNPYGGMLPQFGFTEAVVPYDGILEPGYLQTYSAPAYDPMSAATMSPQLTMAQAALEPAPVQYIPSAAVEDLVVPTINVQQFSAPIPELEPVRYHRVATPEPAPLPKPVMMSGNTVRQTDVERALTPLAAPTQTPREWVPSPATAMRRIY